MYRQLEIRLVQAHQHGTPFHHLADLYRDLQDSRADLGGNLACCR
jgi:hypothetical protein